MFKWRCKVRDRAYLGAERFTNQVSLIILAFLCNVRSFHATLSAALGCNVQIISSEWVGSYFFTEWDR